MKRIMAQKLLTLKVTEEQAEQIKGFITFNDWEIELKEENISVSHEASCAQINRQDISDPFHDETVEECPYCYLQPCY